jgi:hypothetical protein
MYEVFSVCCIFTPVIFTFYTDIYFVNWFHDSALYGNQCTAACKAHMNFAKNSACLTGDNFRNEEVTIHRSQEMLKMLYLYKEISFTINCFVKKERYNNPSCTYSTPDTNFHWMQQDFVG